MAQQQQYSFYENTREKAKLSIVIEGLSGSGKTGLALIIAEKFAGDISKVYGLDTENRSMNLYDGVTMSTGKPMGKFRKFDLTPELGYAPSHFVNARAAAKKNGALVFINDSITHAWQRDGGILDIVSKVDAGNTFRKGWSAWGDSTVIAEKNMIYDTIRDSEIHVISTVRVKEKFEQSTDERGKAQIVSLGEQQQMMPDLKYEADLVLHMVKPGNMHGGQPVVRVIKSRYALFEKDMEYEMTDSMLDKLKAYIDEGADIGELREAQRLEYVKAITDILDANPSKRTLFPVMKEQIDYKNVELANIPLKGIQTLYGMLVN